MFWLLLSLSILLLLFILIIFSKLTILVNYYHHNDNDDLKIEFRIWFGLIKFKKHIPLIKVDDNSPSIVVKDDSSNKDAKQITPNDVLTNLKNTKEILHHVFGMHVIVRKFFQKVTIKKLEWHSFIGVGDAAYTGMATGALWGIKGGIVGLLSHFLKLKEMPHLTVTPHFQAAVIQTQLTCMFQFRIGQAILAGLKLIKFWKGGKPHFKSKADISNEKMKSI
ncbi:DUF2953 domain-containing protein [Neobacillus pocheonensis]|uniref:DUF2953 domain-containing protein n=1 Tax=Neobacillus pocheonensis TaxID=363869 RepID=UPI003D28C0F2